mmetsp:Transcript_122006/g.331303  ORF Transcript_122006/g.331303 Transcript_122006/m.331303 type:complete len:246 (+) Transcript_122006:187-924(+)
MPSTVCSAWLWGEASRRREACCGSSRSGAPARALGTRRCSPRSRPCSCRGHRRHPRALRRSSGCWPDASGRCTAPCWWPACPKGGTPTRQRSRRCVSGPSCGCAHGGWRPPWGRAPPAPGARPPARQRGPPSMPAPAAAATPAAGRGGACAQRTGSESDGPRLRRRKASTQRVRAGKAPWSATPSSTRGGPREDTAPTSPLPPRGCALAALAAWPLGGWQPARAARASWPRRAGCCTRRLRSSAE